MKKYLFINSFCGVGSTGHIVVTLAREQIAKGNICKIAFGRPGKVPSDIDIIRIGTEWDCKWHGIRTRLLDQHGFGSVTATKQFLKEVKNYDPDVIWLHNLHGYYLNIELLFDYLRGCRKKIYWTLHDCWPFTGHCCFFDYAGCTRWRSGCHDCRQKNSYPASFLVDRCKKNYLQKQKFFSGIPNLTIIVPSQWLDNLVQQSFLKEYPTKVVYNDIDRDIFRPVPSEFREKYSLKDKKILLGVANVWEPRKGLRDFCRLANFLDEKYQIVLVGVTERQKKMLPPNILGFPRTNSANELAAVYTAADLFVNPTYEDNYPTVNLEAQACGTPVITYDTGGAKETLSDPRSCVIEKSVNVLAKKIQEVLE